jgi:acyl CoA:acetate/3-ketoacid CoA transferase
MRKLTTAAEAVAKIEDGMLISICGAWMLVPDSTLAALGKRFAETGSPRNLTAVFALCPGGVADQPGIEHLAQEGLLSRVIGGSYPNSPDSRIRRMIAENKVAAYNLPTGMVAHWFREVGARRAGVFTRVGLGSFVDPEMAGGRMNLAASARLVEKVPLHGKHLLHLPSAPVDVSIIRATTADESGNLTFENEPASLTACAQAMAARASGGFTIAQVERVVPNGTLSAHAVKVPGYLVDYVVVDADAVQASAIQRNSALSGTERASLSPAPQQSAIERRIALRAACEIKPGDSVVLGYGVSAYVPHRMLEAGTFEQATFGIEQGSVGGLPLTDFGFGNSLNPGAILDVPTQFDMLQGGCYDLAMLSFLQVDAAGRINVHALRSRPALSVGIGGFLDIASGARRLVFVGYFTAGGLVVDLEGECVQIRQEGKAKKFVRQLDDVSFDPKHSRLEEMLFITERATLKWTRAGFEVVEVAPGVDFEESVKGQMEFALRG